jgi:FAD/FMN-containing dehydrogenase
MTAQLLDRSSQDRLRHHLQALFPGRVTLPEDTDYASARRVWNGAVDHHPRAIVYCTGTEDVQAAVRTARAHGLPLSVRGGGHDVAGRSVRPDGLVVDLSRMDRVEIRGRAAIVAGGATSAKVIAAATENDVLAVTGWNGVTGMAGLTTAGGYGPLLASHGLALDSLVGADLVLADGQPVSVDAGNNPDLLWALQGGGGNFGVITAMTLRLHPPRRMLAGMILFPIAEAAAVLRRQAGVMEGASNDLTVVSGIFSLPDGTPALFLAPAWSGEAMLGERHMEALKRLGTPMHAELGSMSYRAMVESFDARVVNGRHWAAETRSVPALTADVIAALVEGGASRSSPFSAIVLQRFRGMATEVPLEATAFGLRREHIMVEIIASWDPGAADDGAAHRRWARTLSETLAPMSLPGGYPNLLGPHARDQIAHAYAGNLARLQAVKRRLDPDGVFSATPLPVPASR